jgi:alkylation response protein AidB-like acyl-CoA dehydrogenase
MFNLHLSAEQLEIRDTVRDFVTQEIKPVALNANRLDACDRRLLADVLDKASQMGLRTLALSEELGGAGADALTCCIVTEELAAGDADLAAVLAETSALGGVLFARMTKEQRDRFLPRFLDDDHYHLARASDEPDTDTALGVNYHRPTATDVTFKTKAMRGGDGWIINGVKHCVANAPIAQLFAVEAEIEGHGAGTLLVPRDAPGLTVREPNGGRRWYHGACGEVAFAECRVAANSLLPSDGPSTGADGHRVSQLAALNLGIGRAAYEAALDYAQLRVQGGRRIIEHQAIGEKLAEIAIKLEVARNAVWKAAWASDHPQARADRSLADLPLDTVAAVFTSEMIFEATKDAAECFGAMGVMRDMPLQKYVHDARICLHSGHGNADAKLRIAEALIGYRRPAAAIAAE